MFKKKKKEPIVINNTPLVPTTIGIIETKENGPIFAIVWILIFVAGIIGLPYITNWINGNNFLVPNVTPNKPSTPSTPSEPEQKIVYYDFIDSTKVELEGFVLSAFLIDKNTNNLSFQITNRSGKANFFRTHNYFLEIYTKESTLLQRLKIPNKDLTGTMNLSFDISNGLANGDATKFTIVPKEVKDYPQVSLNTNEEKEPILQCVLNDDSVTYTFKEKDGVYNLKKISELREVKNNDATYDDLLDEYTLLAESLNKVNGISTYLLPINTGFSLEISIDLEKISSQDYRRYFNGDIYYAEDVEAKQIAFELETLGYSCK